ncbi:MAG: hypothetical protein ABJA78_15445 [Ferruginibacter sp.]
MPSKSNSRPAQEKKDNVMEDTKVSNINNVPEIEEPTPVTNIEADNDGNTGAASDDDNGDNVNDETGEDNITSRQQPGYIPEEKHNRAPDPYKSPIHLSGAKAPIKPSGKKPLFRK